jgi:peptide deformylase
MEIKLLAENDDFLKQVAEPYDFEKDGDPTELVKTMTRIMFEHNGIGLAAPQVGVGKRLFIMGNQDKLVVCINPEIVEGEGDAKDIEGCLSFPKLWLRVNRYQTIKVKYQNIVGETVEHSLEGLAARVYQHERDHLDGICFDSKVGPVALDLAKEKRRRKSR